MAAERDNGTGIAGVAPGARVQPVRVLGRCGGWDSDILAGIAWSAGERVGGVPDNETPAAVVNLSLGALLKTRAEAARQCQAYESVIRKARSRGAVVVVAAGNEMEDSRLSVPATCAGAVSVGATNRAGRAAWYTNRGPSVDISAYGGGDQVERRSVLSTLDSGTTSPKGNTYGEYQGTSMATPAVAGAAALLRSAGVCAPEIVGTQACATQVEAGLQQLVQPFAKQTTAAARQKVKVPGLGTVTVNTNCTTSACGRGVLDLSRLPAPAGAPRLSGEPVVGEKLTPRWVSLSGTRVDWLRDGVAITGATGARYVVQRDDVGHRLSARVTPSASSLRALAATTQESGVVPDGPVVQLGAVSGARYGSTMTVRAAVTRDGAGVAGRVLLKRGSTTLAEATASSSGAVSFRVPARALAAGKHTLRVAYVGDEDARSTARRDVTVAKATSTVSQKIATKVSRKKRAKLTVTVKAAGVPHPTGTVSVYDGKKKIASAKLTSTGKGKRTIRLPKLKKGTHKIRTVYSGSADISKKTSRTKTVRSR